MSQRNFRMRLRCSYDGEENAVRSLEVEHLADGRWQALDLGIRSPGFEIFVYALFTCQHMYFRTNCAERSLILDSATGEILVGADSQWVLDAVQISFSGRLRGGSAGREDIDYIVSRMKQCPVSANLREVAAAESSIELR